MGDFSAMLSSDLERRVTQLVARDNRQHRPERVELGRSGGGARIDHRPHLVLRDKPREVRGGAERAPVDFGKPEVGVVARHDHVGVAHQADSAADAVAVHRRDHRHRAVVHRGERGEATLVRADQGVEALGVLHLLDVDAGVEAASLGAQHDNAYRAVRAQLLEHARQLEPAGDRQRIDRRRVDHQLGDAPLVDVRRDSHEAAA